MSSLVITSCGSSYLPFARAFITSLRGQGYQDKILVVGNNVNGKNITGLSVEEEVSLRDLGADEVVNLRNLLAISEFPSEAITGVRAKSPRHPVKQAYLTLVARQWYKRVDWIYYFDADMWFQRSFSQHFGPKVFYPDCVTMSSELWSIGGKELPPPKPPRFIGWVKETDVVGMDAPDFIRIMEDKPNINSGFIASTSELFLRFCNLWWAVSATRLMDFRTDQPALNILLHYFGYSRFKAISKILHISNFENSGGKLRANEDGTALVTEHGFVFPVIHFNHCKLLDIPDEFLNHSGLHVLKGMKRR